MVKKGILLLSISIFLLFNTCQKASSPEAPRERAAREQKILLVRWEKVAELWWSKKFKEAIKFCEDYLSQNPKAPDRDKAQFALAYLWYDYNNLDRDYQKALQEFQKFLSEYPDSELYPEAQYWLANTYYNLCQYRNAIREYQKIKHRYLEEEDKLMKRKWCKWCYGGGKAHKTAVFLIGYIYDEEYGDFEKALLYYNDVYQNSPDSVARIKAKERIRAVLRKIEQRVLRALPLIEYEPVVDIWHDLDFGKAWRVCETALSTVSLQEKEKVLFAQIFLTLDPRSPYRNPKEAVNKLGKLSKEASQARVIRKALFWAGILALEERNYPLAISFFKKLGAKFPESYLARRATFRIANIYHDMGQLKRAKEIYQALLPKIKNEKLKRLVEMNLADIEKEVSFNEK
jgi:TolA-binding protein